MGKLGGNRPTFTSLVNRYVIEGIVSLESIGSTRVRR